MRGRDGDPNDRLIWLHPGSISGRAYDEQIARRVGAGNPHGEADFVESLGGRRVLDAGCGTGRVAIELARRGFEVVGVDLDPALIATAREKAPEIEWRLDDLATVDLGREFDTIVLAGNVMIFLAPGTAGRVLANLARHLAPEGHLAAGFQHLPGCLTFEAHDRLAVAAGLRFAGRWATWDQQPWRSGGTYAVTVHQPMAPA